MTAQARLGWRVLVVEDEALIAMLVEEMLRDMGCTLAKHFPSLPQALEGAEAVEADVAVLDVNVAGREVFPLAERLEAKRMPLVFATGYGASGLPERWQVHQIISKPYEPGALREALIAAMSRRR